LSLFFKGNLPLLRFGRERTLVALGQLGPEPARVKPTVDWKALELDPEKSLFSASAIPDFQETASFKPGEAIPVRPGKGWLLVVGEEKKRWRKTPEQRPDDLSPAPAKLTRSVISGKLGLPFVRR
jgi:hypothetical protein